MLFNITYLVNINKFYNKKFYFKVLIFILSTFINNLFYKLLIDKYIKYINVEFIKYNILGLLEITQLFIYMLYYFNNHL